VAKTKVQSSRATMDQKTKMKIWSSFNLKGFVLDRVKLD